VWDETSIEDGEDSDRWPRVLSWSNDATVRIWQPAPGPAGEVNTGGALHILRHADVVQGAMWNDDTSRVLSWSDDGMARVWDAETGDELLSLEHRFAVGDATWSADEKLILSLSNAPSGCSTDCSYDVLVWDAQSGELLATLPHEASVSGGLFSADASRVLTFADQTLRIWNVSSGDILFDLRHDNRIAGAAWDADANRVLFSSYEGDVGIWSPGEDEALRILWQGGLTAASARWSADGRRVLSWADDVVRVWDAASGEMLQALGHGGFVDGAVWVDGGETSAPRVLSWASDAVYIWDAASGETQLILPHGQLVGGAALSADETQVLSWAIAGTVQVWTVDIEALIDAGKARKTRELSSEERAQAYLAPMEVP
jgi:WD40 repeat protein